MLTIYTLVKAVKAILKYHGRVSKYDLNPTSQTILLNYTRKGKGKVVRVLN
jgi:hypothetical protein